MLHEIELMTKSPSRCSWSFSRKERKGIEVRGTWSIQYSKGPLGVIHEQAVISTGKSLPIIYKQDSRSQVHFHHLVSYHIMSSIQPSAHRLWPCSTWPNIRIQAHIVIPPRVGTAETCKQANRKEIRKAFFFCISPAPRRIRTKGWKREISSLLAFVLVIIVCIVSLVTPLLRLQPCSPRFLSSTLPPLPRPK